MSSSSYTTHYELSQYDSLDKPSWIQDYNADMAKIDTAIYEASQGGGQTITLYESTGQNTDGAMTQKATTDMVFKGGSTNKICINGASGSQGNNTIAIGTSATTLAQQSIAIGSGSSDTNNQNSVCIGNNAKVTGSSHPYSVSLGANTNCEYGYSVSLGSYSHPRAQGVVDVKALDGSTKRGYQGTGDAQRTEYRVISGVHAGEDEHDVAIVGQIIKCVHSTIQPTPQTAGEVGTFWIYTFSPQTNVEQATIYVCITADSNQNYYEWRQLF